MVKTIKLLVISKLQIMIINQINEKNLEREIFSIFNYYLILML
jgi:hypothetical protein